MLTDGSTLVLWGPPGIGKTHRARMLVGEHDGPVVWWTPEGLIARLARLADAWEHAPGSAISRQDLFETGWPDVHINAESAGTRLRTELSRLRKLGLRPQLQQHEDGYRLDPETVVVRG